MNSTLNPLIFAALGLLALGSALAAVTLRQAVHCGLSIALCFVGVALIYIYLGAEFVGFAHLLVYVGAVAVLIMFVILLTRLPGAESPQQRRRPLQTVGGIAVGLAVFSALANAILGSASMAMEASAGARLSIDAIGKELVSGHLFPLLIIGVFLTVALIGSALFAYGNPENR